MLAAVADDTEWHIIGDRDIKGIEAFGDALDDAWRAIVRRLSFATVLTHKDQGSVSGSMTLASGKTLHFCDVHTFTSHGKDAKIGPPQPGNLNGWLVFPGRNRYLVSHGSGVPM